nr:hypothetical protein AXF42_Ash000089 [Ipomoea batatas]
MLVHITRRRAVSPENRVVNDVGHDLDGQPAIGFEPLGPFSPVGEGNRWVHSLVVSAAPDFARIVEESEEAHFGVYEDDVRLSGKIPSGFLCTQSSAARQSEWLNLGASEGISCATAAPSLHELEAMARSFLCNRLPQQEGMPWEGKTPKWS